MLRPPPSVKPKLFLGFTGLPLLVPELFAEFWARFKVVNAQIHFGAISVALRA